MSNKLVISSNQDDRNRIVTENFLQIAKERGIPELNIADFDLLDWVADGGYGTVFKAKRKEDGKMVALKFFGYIKQQSTMSDQDYIENSEIIKDWELNKLNCVAKVLGYLFDTFDGLVTGKPRLDNNGRTVETIKYLKGCYMCKISECLHMDIFTAITTCPRFTQRDASTLFRNLILALHEIHEAGYIHRDIKPENIMFEKDHSDLSDPNRLSIKLIDFGLATLCPQGQVEIASKVLVGSPRYEAPEQLERLVNSKATDIWQAGVTLYIIMLHSYPFHNRQRVLDIGKKPFSMSGSPHAKSAWYDDSFCNLLELIFVDDSKRISLSAILNHSWLRDWSALSDIDLGDDFRKSIKKWIHRKKFRQTLEKKIHISANTREALDNILNRNGSSRPSISTIQFRKLQSSFLSVERVTDDDSSTVAAQNGIDVDAFCNLLSQHGLPQLALPEVFFVFDVDQNHIVSYFEFLLVLISFRESHGDDDEQSKFFFELFDLDGSDDVSINEFKNVVSHLLIETLEIIADSELDHIFDTIDIYHHEKLSFPEFKSFFKEIVKRSADISLHRAAETSPDQHHHHHHHHRHFHGYSRGGSSHHSHHLPQTSHSPHEKERDSDYPYHRPSKSYRNNSSHDSEDGRHNKCSRVEKSQYSVDEPEKGTDVREICVDDRAT